MRWTGRPNGSRGTIGGCVRMLNATVAAPPSARSVAISAPLLPAPTTRTRLPDTERRFDSRRNERASQRRFRVPARGQHRDSVLPRRDDDGACAPIAAARDHRPRHRRLRLLNPVDRARRLDPQVEMAEDRPGIRRTDPETGIGDIGSESNSARVPKIRVPCGGAADRIGVPRCHRARGPLRAEQT